LLAVEQGKKSMEIYYQEKEKFGKISLLSNVDEDPSVVYNLYKDREQIEYAFNVFKNLLESDKNCLRENAQFEGYTFFNLISLYIYYLVLNRLRISELNRKYSVKDVILQFFKVKIYDFDGGELMSEIPKKVRELAENLGVNLNLLRINWES
jgi:transposase